MNLQQPPRNIAVVSGKGGVGKSTVAMAIATALNRTLVDADAQQTSRHWHRNRPVGSTPNVISDHLTNIPFLVQEHEGLVVDTPGSTLEKISEALAVMDLVLVVTSDRWAELDAVGASLAVTAQAGCPVVVLFNRIHPAADPSPAIEFLQSRGATVCPVVLRERAAHYQAQLEARTAIEQEPTSKAAQEIRALIDWLQGVN